MDDPDAVGIDAELFMHLLSAHTAILSGSLLGEEATDAFVRLLGENIGSWVEQRYRRAWGLTEPLTPEEYARLVSDFKCRVGGCMQASTDDAETVCLRNTRCPYAEITGETDLLCRLDAAIFGSIAARNFGYARVLARSTLVTGGPFCDLEVSTRRNGHAARLLAAAGAGPATGVAVLEPEGMDLPALVAEYEPSPLETPQEVQRRLIEPSAVETLRREVGFYEAALAQANRSLEALLGVSAAITANLDEEALLRQLVQCAMALSGGPAGFVARPQGEMLVAREWCADGRWHPASLCWHGGAGTAGRCRREGRGIVGTTDDDGALAGLPVPAAGFAWVCAPIASPQGELLGVVGVLAPTATAVERARLLEGAARQAAVALANARLYAAQRQEAEHARALLAELQQKSEALAAMQERLVDAEKLAALGLFGQGLAHDLRNPLSVIQTALYTLTSRVDPADARGMRALNAASDQARRAERIIRDMLALTQQRPPNPSRVPLCVIARETLRGLTVPEGVRVEIDVPEDLPAAWVDPGHALQVLQNLCQNALEALEGAGRVRLEAEAGDGTVAVRVIDTGPGITPEDLANVFRPFWSKKASHAHGFGIGLALSRALAEHNGGALSVRSEPGKGSVFTLTLPAAP